jgi:sialidase-1
MKVVDTGIVYTNPKPYLRTVHAIHPTIVDLGDGEMLCEFSLAQAQEAVDHLGYQSRSLDGGKTWEFEDRTIPVNTVRPSSHTVRVSNTSTGLVGFGARFWRDDPEVGMIANRENFGFVPMDLILIRSDDKGKTWSCPETVVPPLDGPGFEICHNILELPDGTWLAPCSTQRVDGLPFNARQSVVLISRDKGLNWNDYGVAFDGTEDGTTHWETSVCSLGGNDLLAVTWPYHEASATHLPNRFTISNDGGKTFQPFGEIGIRGQTCKALRLDDGKILLVYRRNDKPGLWASLFDLSDSTWTMLSEMPLWGSNLVTSGMTGDAAGSDELSALKFGFPQMIQLDSGEVFVVFWCFEDWSCCIRWIKISVDAEK